MLALSLTLAAAACMGKSKHDIYMEGLVLEGDAERGVCKLHFGDGQTMQAISGDRVQECLRITNEALELYDQAERMGMADVDFQRVHARAKERIAKLEGMLKQLRVMEHEASTPPPM